MAKTTIGGDRLGAGKKMTVDLKSYSRSTHNMGYIWRSTMAAGTLVPFMSELGLPGDTFDIDLDCDIKTHPTIGPLFGSYKIQLDVFLAPIRLYQAQLHNNALGIGMKMETIKLPQIELKAASLVENKEPDNQQINPSSILSYFNIRGLGHTAVGDTVEEVAREFNALPILSYWDIYKNYYANKQEEIGAVIHNEPGNIAKTVSSVVWRSTGATGSGTAVTENGENPTSTLTLYKDSTLHISFTGTELKIEDIILNVYLSNGSAGYLTSIAAVDLYGDIAARTGSYFLSQPGFPNGTIVGWKYREGTDVIYGEPKVKLFDLKNLDTMRNDLLKDIEATEPYIINENSIEPYNLPLLKSLDGDTYSKMASQEGLALKTYQSDLFNNWMSTEWIDGENGINEITAIDVSDGVLKLDTLNISQKVYNMLNRIAISGGSYDDWQEAVYSHTRTRMATSPMYMGGLMRELVFQEVVSNAQAEGGDEGKQPLGTLAGKGVMGGKKKGGKISIKVDEPSYIIGIISLTPRIDYSQGNKWDTNLKTIDDFHKPALDEIGFQDLITDQMAWWDTEAYPSDEGTLPPRFKSAGKQPAWLNYMTNVNQVRGNFAVAAGEGTGGQMFMTLNRKYEKSETNNILDLTTYIDPVKFNHIFAETARDAQNFWAQISLDITARRKMSAKIMPNL